MKREKTYNYTYRIDNLINGKYYYGKHSAESLDNDYMGSGKLITAAIEKYKPWNFKKTILKTFSTSEEAFAHEAELVTQQEVDNPMCYNIALGGYGGNLIAGKSEEEKSVIYKKISQSNKGKKKNRTEEQLAEWKHTLSIANKGKKLTPEQRKQISETRKTNGLSAGENNPMYGKHHSEESKKKMSENRKGRPSPNKGVPQSEETKRKISNTLKGNTIPEEVRKKISNTLKGRTFSEETLSKKRKSKIITDKMPPNILVRYSLSPGDVFAGNKPMAEQLGISTATISNWKAWGWVCNN